MPKYSGAMTKSDTLAQATRFHGHLGPWLVLGLKAGMHARRELKASPFELTARVLCPGRPPCSCFVDGVQYGSGCTMGKGNIIHVPASGCRVEFVRRAARSSPGHRRDLPAARLIVELRPEVRAELSDDETAGWAAANRFGKSLYRRSFASLFNIIRR